MILEHIETRAEAVLQAAGVRTIPVPVEDLAAKNQLLISRAPHTEFSGLLIRKDGHALIGINSREPLVRQRFTIAHELGHFFLHPQKDTFVDYRDNKKEVMRTPREKQANMFAAALLMPRASLLKDFRSIAKHGFTEDELTALAKRYEVSEDAMRFRLLNLNLLAAA
ncbi:MAG TPA: ImmA/IrrE family metallo-endopeptidase [Gemmatimonadaceae bacterium]|nr:ImmA/IrrE family metallo-endopeptidase [Gemmatimonadaceae bacterium]